jgi:hypothetical protein
MSSTACSSLADGCRSPTSLSTTRFRRTRASESTSGPAESPERCSTGSTRACWSSGLTPTSNRASSSPHTRTRPSRTPAARPPSSEPWDRRSGRPSRGLGEPGGWDRANDRHTTLARALSRDQDPETHRWSASDAPPASCPGAEGVDAACGPRLWRALLEFNDSGRPTTARYSAREGVQTPRG